MGNKKGGNLPPIVKDHTEFHITHMLDDKMKHTGKLSIYAGKNKRKEGFKNIKEAIDYIDKLLNGDMTVMDSN